MNNQEFEKFIDFFEKEGYTHVKYIEGLGYCGLRRMYLTIALCHGLDEHGLLGRWCYSNHSDAVEAINKLDSVQDPDDEFWIKYKGIKGEYSNPKIKQEYE